MNDTDTKSHSIDNFIVSKHQPYVRRIVQWKSHANMEFGANCKSNEWNPEITMLTPTNNSPSTVNRSVLNIIAGVHGQKAEQVARGACWPNATPGYACLTRKSNLRFHWVYGRT